MASQLLQLKPHNHFIHNHPIQRQIGFWKTDNSTDYFDGKLRAVGDDSLSSSPMEKWVALDSQILKDFDIPTPYVQDQKVHLSLDKHPVGAGRETNHSSWKALDHDLGARPSVNMEQKSYCMAADKINFMGDTNENSLFSSSLSELFSRKMRLSSNNAHYGHSVGDPSDYELDEPFESVEELEANTIENLLPNDDDLLSGMIDGLSYTAQPNSGDSGGDLDVFSNVGGMDLGEDGISTGQRNLNGHSGISFGSTAGEHPHGEHPSRTLFVRNINSNVEDSELRALFEQYGDIHTLYTACKQRGFVMISYYDIRAAQNAMKALQNKPLRHRMLDIHFSIPKDNVSDKDVNQGTLVVFIHHPSVENDDLYQFFGAYGEVKEIREIPHKSHHKIVEFYDIRAANVALRALSNGDVAGKQFKLESSRPGGTKRLMQPFPELDTDETAAVLQMCGSPTDLMTRLSGMVPYGRNTSASMGNVAGMTTHTRNGRAVSQSLDSKYVQSQGQMKLDFRAMPNFHPHSLPDYYDGLANAPHDSPGNNMVANITSRPAAWSNGHALELNGSVFGPSGNSTCPSPTQQYMWNNLHHPQGPQPHGMMWPSSPSFVNGIYSAHTSPQLHALPKAPSLMTKTLVPLTNHHVGSAPSMNPSLWDRQNAYAGESSAASGFLSNSLGSMRIPGNSPLPLESVPLNMFTHVGGNCMDLPIPSKSVGLPSRHKSVKYPSRGQRTPLMNSLDSPNGRARNRRTERGLNQVDNQKQFELDMDRIMRGEDRRTTLMIKNIPNKYTSKLLLDAVDECHRGTYDFIYLPIDFKNKCNVGYAFINMVDPSLVIPFCQTFNGKKWEKFNSEKVVSLAYARIQGKAALISHFQNSSLMIENKRYRPMLFHTDGPNAGDQVPFPMGENVGSKPNKKNQGSTSEGTHLEGPVEMSSRDDSSNGDSSSVSGKDYD